MRRHCSMGYLASVCMICFFILKILYGLSNFFVAGLVSLSSSFRYTVLVVVLFLLYAVVDKISSSSMAFCSTSFRSAGILLAISVDAYFDRSCSLRKSYF